MNPFNRHNRLRENLSAYIDGELAPGDAGVVEKHLETCAACRAELEDLSAASTALAKLPTVEPSRSFSLTPHMVAAPRAAPPTRPSPAIVTGMRFAAAGLAVALAAVMIVDRADFGGTDNSSRESAISLQGAQDLAAVGAAENSADSQRSTDSAAADRAGMPPPAATSVPGSGAGANAGVGTVASPAPAAGPTPAGGAAASVPTASANAKNIEPESSSSYEAAAPSTNADSAQNAAPAPAAGADNSSGLTALDLIEGLLAALLGAAIGGLVLLWLAQRWRPV